MLVGTYRLFAHPMSMITTVGILYTGLEMKTGGKCWLDTYGFSAHGS